MASQGSIQVEGYTPLRTGRYERKCQVTELTLHQIQLIVKLHPKLFHSPYPPRYVNSIYLDTADLENYQANVLGYTNRRKVRLRWYGESFGEIAKPMLEIKIKQGLVGTKQAFPLTSMTIDCHVCDDIVHHTLSNSDLPRIVQLELQNMHMVLLNRYYRHYYVSYDGDFRVTIDSELAFYKINSAFGNLFLHRQLSRSEVIVEIKYAEEQEPSADRVINFFPFRVTRSSKYVQGVERVYF
jgi:hypothetical protein